MNDKRVNGKKQNNDTPVKGIFVTGTDTGVGKTVVAATIARLLRESGIDVGVMKPVTSGCIAAGGRLVSEDAELLKWAAGCDPADQDVTPYLLREPLAPSMAASREGVRIDFTTIKEAYDRLSSRHSFMIVEGAGGLMVPLSGGMLIADLVNHLKLPIIVITRPNLGTINHTHLTTFAAGQLGIQVKGIIINNYPDRPDAAEEYAPHLLASLCGAPILGIFSRLAGDNCRDIVERLATKLSNEPTAKIMLREIGIG